MLSIGNNDILLVLLYSRKVTYDKKTFSTKISHRFQTSIPVKIRNQIELNYRTKAEIWVKDGAICIKPITPSTDT